MQFALHPTKPWRIETNMALKFAFLVIVSFIALTARAQSPICYAAPEGKDTNDGSYWAFAKADLMSCYDALPVGGGTIYFRDSGVKGKVTSACSPSDPPGCGIWIMNASDPNYAHPSAGWRR